jgi:protein-ribulosamine 3-kinase
MRCAKAVEAAIQNAIGQPFSIEHLHEVRGGCINRAWIIEGSGCRCFVKTNQSHLLDMFAAEAEGLRELESAAALRVPQPIAYGNGAGNAFLVLEYLELGGYANSEEMGRMLALQHRKTASQYGWKRDNTIGSTAQPNPWMEDWIEFLRRHRLGFQLGLAAQHGYGGKMQIMGEKLLSRLADFFAGYRPVPSLLHGDLWGGNVAFARSGVPVVFDPAVYYGDREADLAMSELFGGFSAGFYAAYEEAWPLDDGYPIRKTLYNLYHILNHTNLFGGGYARQAQTMMSKLLAQIS